VVVTVGLAVTVAPVAADNLVAGVQVNVAPGDEDVAVKVVKEPLQIALLPEVKVTWSITVNAMVFVWESPHPFVTVKE
jgi:hypothetical protein